MIVPGHPTRGVTEMPIYRVTDWALSDEHPYKNANTTLVEDDGWLWKGAPLPEDWGESETTHVFLYSIVTGYEGLWYHGEIEEISDDGV